MYGIPRSGSSGVFYLFIVAVINLGIIKSTVVNVLFIREFGSLLTFNNKCLVIRDVSLELVSSGDGTISLGCEISFLIVPEILSLVLKGLTFVSSSLDHTFKVSEETENVGKNFSGSFVLRNLNQRLNDWGINLKSSCKFILVFLESGSDGLEFFLHLDE